MEATNFSVISTYLYQTTRHHVSVIYVLFAIEFFEKTIFFSFSCSYVCEESELYIVLRAVYAE